MATSFAEAVRIFARQSVQENGMPFVVTANQKNTFGRLSKYVTQHLIAEEKDAYRKAMVEKHEKTN